MKTYLTVYLFTQSFLFLVWLAMLLIIKPTYGRYKYRWQSNIDEGGLQMLPWIFGGGLAIAYLLTKMILMFNFLEQ